VPDCASRGEGPAKNGTYGPSQRSHLIVGLSQWQPLAFPLEGALKNGAMSPHHLCFSTMLARPADRSVLLAVQGYATRIGTITEAAGIGLCRSGPT